MRSRKQHTGKSRKAKEYYVKQLQQLNYEPTVDDSLDFASSDDTDEDLRVSSKTGKLRRPKIEDRIKEHIKENWLYWVVSFISILLIYFVFNFNRDIGKIEGNIEIIKDNVSEIKTRNEKFIDKVHSQELKTHENRLRIENIEKDINSKEKNK